MPRGALPRGVGPVILVVEISHFRRISEAGMGVYGEFLARYDAMLARWPVPVRTLDIPGRHGTTRVIACGPADGPATVLLPGGGATATVWWSTVGALAD